MNAGQSQDLQAKVKTFESLNWIERNLTAPRGSTGEQENAFHSARYWLNSAEEAALKGNHDVAELAIRTAQQYTGLSGVDFSRRIKEIRSYYQPSS